MKLTVLLTRAPYGSIQAAEAVRHVMGAVGEDIDVKLLLVDEGVYLAKKGQEAGQTEYTSLEEALKDIIDMGGEVLIDKASLRDSGLDREDIIEGVEVVNSYDISQVLIDTDKTMIF